METEELSLEVAEKDTAAELAAEAAASDPANRPPKRSSNTCQPCRLRKVRCVPGDGVSCANCDRLGFTCSFGHESSPHGDGENGSISLPRRRVRLACSNCHSRKARCSGETPKCARCQAQGIECVYRPTKRSGAIALNGNASLGPTGDSEHESVSSEPPDKRRHLDGDAASRQSRALSADHQNSGGDGAFASWAMNHEPSINFPDESLITRTFNNYFRHVHHVPVFSFLHRASLMQRYHAGMMDKTLLLAVVGITSLLTDLGPGMREYGYKCVDECQRMILNDLENPSTIKIQALVLVMKHRMLTQRFTAAFMLAAIVGRFALALRLNYENPTLCFLARESRRRLMWAFLTIDSGINGGYSSFTVLPAEAMHIQLPCNERNFEFDLPQVTEPLKPMPDKPYPEDIGSLASHVRLLWVRSRILYATKSALAIPESDLCDQLPRIVDALAQELEDFNERLPISFRFSENNIKLRTYSPRLCVFMMLHVWFRQCYCDLYRIVLAGLKGALPRSSVDKLPPSFVASCERQCYEHAVAMADVFRVLLSVDGGLPVTDLDLPVCAFQCAQILYFGYRSNAADFPLNAEQVQEHAQRCLQITRHMIHVPAGLAVHDDLNKFITRGLSASATPSGPVSPEAPRAGAMPQQPLAQHNPIHQMNSLGDGSVPMVPPTPTPSDPVPAPINVSGVPDQQTTISYATPPTMPARPMSSFDVSMTDTGMPKPNLPPVDPPEGLDNNNAFEGAMDGFDFNFESFGNTGLDSASWFSNEWLNAEFMPQTTV